jgi:hypothetical protein
MNILRHLFGSNKPASTPQEESSLMSTTPSVHQVPAPAISTGEELEEPNPETLRNALNIFIFQKATMVEKREMLHDTPLLLTPEAVTMCQEIARDAQGQHAILAQAWDFLATLLETAQAHGIDAAMDEWERSVGNEVNVNLLTQWLSTSTHRDERRFLQHHPEMLTDTLEGSLQVALELIRQDETLNPRQRQERVETGYQRLHVVRDIRARISRLQGSGLFSDDASLTNQAVLEGYINWKGGFMLDLPAWLETTIKESVALRRKYKQLSQTAVARANLWKKALKRAQREELSSEIIAEIAQRIWDALDDITANQPEVQEEALAFLKICLQSYTEERYPYQWATIQNQLGSTYNDRIRGDKADNLEQAISCYNAALSVYTEDTLPSYHRLTALSYAVTLAERRSWDKAHLAYLSALRAENALYALAASAKEQDVILVGGRDGALQDAYALVRLGKLGEAAVTLEQGQARGLAAARAFNTADPLHITDATRRADYLVKRDALRQSLAALQQPEEHLLANDTSTQAIDPLGSHAKQNARYLALSKRFRQDQAAFYATVETIRAAGDPADFLDNHVTEASLLATVQRGPVGHAVISLMATPWGGMALGAFSANPARQTPGRFVALDLPALTSDAVRNLVAQFLDRDSSTILGGFMFAAEGSIFSILEGCWADRQQPSWDGTTPLQEWERQGAPGRKEALDTATFMDMAGWLHEVCQLQGISSTLDAASQEVLHQTHLHFIVAKPWNGLTNKQQTRLREAVTQAFLLREVEHVLDALSDWVMRPLAAWLREEGVTTVSIVPGGYLAAFPILSCDVGNGKTFADMFSASVAPNLRSLVQHEYTHPLAVESPRLEIPFPSTSHFTMARPRR